MKCPEASDWKVIGERVIDGRTARRADDGDGLRRELFRHDDAEARPDLRHQAQKDRCRFTGQSLRHDEATRLAHRLREQAARRVIAAVDEAVVDVVGAEREHFQTGQRRIGIGKVFAFAARDLGDRPKDDDGRDRKLDGKARHAEDAADRARCRGRRLVQEARVALRAAFGKGSERDVHGRVDGALRRAVDQTRDARRQEPAQRSELLADGPCEACREVRVLERPDGALERRLIGLGEDRARATRPPMGTGRLEVVSLIDVLRWGRARNGRAGALVRRPPARAETDWFHAGLRPAAV